MGQPAQPVPPGNPVHYERRRPEDTTLYQVVQEPLETFLAQMEAETGARLPDFVKDEFDAFLECGIVALGFLCLRCAQCAHAKLVAFSCKRRGFCPSLGGALLLQTDASGNVSQRGPESFMNYPGQGRFGRRPWNNQRKYE